MMNEKTTEIYNQTKQIFPSSDDPKYQYVRREWIFPNHIDIMLDLVEGMCEKYGGDVEICQLACILHDTGLVYKRDSASSIDHEERSLEYAENILKNYPNKQQILDCIKATEPKIEPQTINEKIVRTADALSQFISIHFIAKAHFAQNLEEYISWLEGKLENNFKKICFEDEQKQGKIAKKYLENAVKLYRKSSFK